MDPVDGLRLCGYALLILAVFGFLFLVLLSY